MPPEPPWDASLTPDGHDVHVRPLRDHMWHPLTDDCPCGPETLFTAAEADHPDRWLYLHHALDGRPRRDGGYTITPHPVHGHHGDDDPGLAGCAA